jgi:hypothetical protein
VRLALLQLTQPSLSSCALVTRPIASYQPVDGIEVPLDTGLDQTLPTRIYDRTTKAEIT